MGAESEEDMSGARGMVTHDGELPAQHLPAQHEEQLAREGDVIGTVDPFVLPPESRIGRPFVTMGELDPGSFAPGDHHAMNLLVDREREFFTDLGLEHLLTRGSGDTAGSMGVVSITYSPVGLGGRYVEDDTLPEGSYEHP